jgi:hypothetical protein
MNKKYIDLLEAIVKNSNSLKIAASSLLEKSIKTKDEEMRLSFAAYALNFIFAFIDELGKYYIIKAQYPRDFKEGDFKKIGFRHHETKIKKLVSVVRSIQLARGSVSPFTIKQTVSMLRGLKDTTLYVDYKNGNIINPFDSQTLKRESFKSYIDMVYFLEKMVMYDLELFKQDHNSNIN